MNREELVQRMDAATLGAFDIASTYLGREAGPVPVALRGRAGDRRRAGGSDGDQRAAGARVARAAGRHRAAGRDERRTASGGSPCHRATPPYCSIRTPWTAWPARSAPWSPTSRRCRGWSSRSEPAWASRTPTTVRTRPRARRWAPDRSTGPRSRAGWPPYPTWRSGSPTGTARVLDIGCGVGWSSVCMAQGLSGRAWWTASTSTPRSIEAAQLVADAEGVADRVRFELRDAATLAGAGYDLATMFEMLHDLARPVEALRAAREALNPDGVVLVADEPSVTPSPGRPTTRSGATTATACCTACPRA